MYHVWLEGRVRSNQLLEKIINDRRRSKMFGGEGSSLITVH